VLFSEASGEAECKVTAYRRLLFCHLLVKRSDIPSCFLGGTGVFPRRDKCSLHIVSFSEDAGEDFETGTFWLC
jgi:hypothetical protein